MELSELTEEEKTRLYDSFLNGEIDGHPYVVLGPMDLFFNPNYEPKKISFWRRLYHTLVPSFQRP